MYVTNQKYFMFILFIFLLVFSMVDITHALPVCDRTTQVREAIVTAADVAFCSDVTDAHLAAITTLDLTEGIETLKNGDFDGLSALTTLSLNSNGLTWLPQDVFAGLTALTNLSLDGNLFTWLYPDVFDGLSALTSLSLDDNMPLTWLPANIFDGLDKLTSLSLDRNALTWLPAFDGLSALTSLSLDSNALTWLPNGVFAGLSALTSLSLDGNPFTWLPADIFDGLSALTSLSLDSNALTWLPNGVFDGLTALTTLSVVRVDVNADPLQTIISLEKVGAGQFKATASTGAPFDIALPISVTNGNISNGVSTITIPIGSLESEPLTVARTAGTSVAVTVDIGTLPSIPSNHQGYVLARHEDLPLEVIGESVNVPVFTEGSTTIRTIAENTAAGVDIGSAVSATDVDADDTLTYSLGGTDAASFNIVSTTGQLKTKAALDHETTSSYTVSISVSDGTGVGTDTIAVTINITDVNEAPVFADGSTTTRTIAENTAANENIGTSVSADDPENNTLTYSLSGTDAASFDIDTTSGQLKTNAALDYETKNAYSVTVSVSDGNSGEGSITVRINVTDVNEAPIFTTDGGTTIREIAENTAAGVNIGSAVSATDQENDTLTYSLSGTDAASFDIVSTSGQLQTKDTLDYETKQSYSVTITVSDGDTLDSLSDTITVTITVTDVNDAPVFTDHGTTTRSIAENTLGSIGSAVAATDEDADDTLTYSLGGTDAASFDIVSTSGQLQTKAALDYETKNAYSVTVSVSDGTLTDTIDVTINVTDVAENRAPVFTEGEDTTRAIAENTTDGIAIGTLVSATDADDDPLTYSLGGTDAASFDIDSSSGQLKTKTALDFETKQSYSVTINVSDGTLTDTITVTITVTDVNDAPMFTDGEDTTRAIAENTATDVAIEDPVEATDQENDTLTYTLSGIDAASFSIVSTSGQLQTNAALDYETKNAYSVTVSVSDGTFTDTINVTINVTDVAENRAPVFTEGEDTTRAIAENTAAGVNIGSAVSATDQENDILTYSLSGTDAASFDIVSTSGQLQTNAALDYETKQSYSVTISVSDGTLTDTINVTINVTDVAENRAPVFTEGEDTTRAIAENTATDADIGAVVAATDDADDTLTYTLSGTNASSFSIVSTSGQLRTRAALNYEAKSSYSVTITVSDGTLSDTITVTINVTNVNEAPVFTNGSSTTRTVAENTASSTNIGSAVSATDVDVGTTLRYTLGGTNASSFSIVSTSGQLKTKAALDHESKSSYSVTVSVSDGNGGSDSITVRINVTDVNEAPVFDDGATTTRWIAENTRAGVNIQSAVSATDVDVGTTLRYTLGGTNAASFSIVSTSGQLQTNAALDYETKRSYSVTINVSDGTLTDTITVRINVTNVNEAPVFTNGSTTTRTVAENTRAGVNIQSAVSATDVDVGNTLTYSLGGTNASSFSINSTSGQLQTNAALDYETKQSYSVTINVSDGTLTDTITVRINVTNVNEAPVFTNGSTTTRSIAENTRAGVNIQSVVSATDVDVGTTLRYTLGGTNASSFSIVSTSGQLKTKAALNHESKSSYSVTVSVSDGNGGSDSITVRINVTDVNEAPVFDDGATTTRWIDENVGGSWGGTISDTVSATDEDVGDTLRYTLSGTDAALFSIDNTGQLSTTTYIDYESTPYYYVTATVSDGDLSDTIDVTIEVSNVNEAPVFDDGATTARWIDENVGGSWGGTISDTVSATDEDVGDTLRYTLSGTDAASFSIDNTGQLSTTTYIDYESTPYYYVTATVSDGDLSDTIDVTIEVSNVNEAPVFDDGATTARWIDENTRAGVNIQRAVSATDEDVGNTLTYSLGGTNASSFSINSTTGQLQTNAALDYETKTSYSVTISVSDGNSGSDSISVTIYVTDVNEAPVFDDGATTVRWIDENTRAGVNIQRAVSATDADNDTLTYSLGGTDAASFDIDTTSGQLQTNAALDYETKTSYSVTISVSDGNSGSDSISVRINVRDVDENRAPVFTNGSTTTRSVYENTPSGRNIGSAVSATDADNDTLRYSLSGTDAASFDIVSTSGQLQTSAALDYETKRSYSVTITVSDDNDGTDTITVTITITDVDENRAPVFSDGSTTTRSVYENTPSGRNIGSAVSATDADNDTLRYSLSGTDVSSFSIVSTSGQLRTSAALNYEAKRSYSVTITVSDGNGRNDSISVTINVRDLDEIRPRVTISVPSGTQTGPFDVTITFTEAVLGFDQSDLTLFDSTNASIAWTETSSTTYTATITPANSGVVLINVRAGVATDAANNPNRAAAKLVTVDIDSPEPTISAPSGTQTGPFGVTITFTEAVSGFDQSDLFLLDSTNASITAWTGTSSTTYTATITPANSGVMVIGVGAGVATDAAGNPNTVAAAKVVTVDMDPPEPTISASPGTQHSPFDVTITFTETVSGFDQSNLSIPDSVSITAWTESGTTYTATATSTSIGEVTFSVSAGVATDTAGNGNTAASLTVTVPARVEDINEDGVVDINDLTLVAAAFGQTGDDIEDPARM